MESVGLLKATMVAKGMASYMQQDSASQGQTLASPFYCYKIVVVADESI